MTKKTIAVALLSGSFLFTSCGLSNAIKGGGIGTAAGAALGAGIGNVAGNTGLGAAIGAVVGGAAGALIGNKMDKQKKELEEAVEGAKIESVNDGQAIRVTFDSGILFATSSANLSQKSIASLKAFADNAKTNGLTNIQIIGHTDNTGTDRINDPLSVNRAKSVYNYLASQGVDAKRMSFLGKGSHEPIADNTTAEGRKENRRVEVYILPSQEMIEAAQNGTLK
ncbi:MAG: OmpA family protein [Porphyromonadaceae bacterium]|nr:OmpA family protein [Porphyromonadaceae bacterium]